MRMYIINQCLPPHVTEMTVRHSKHNYIKNKTQFKLEKVSIIIIINESVKKYLKTAGKVAKKKEAGRNQPEFILLGNSVGLEVMGLQTAVI